MATVIVNGGQAIMTNLLTGIGGTVPKYIGWGTGAQTTALITDTGLGPTTVEKLIDLTTSGNGSNEARTSSTPTRTTTTVTNDTETYTGTRTATGGAGGTVTCAGLFDAVQGGNLYCKTDFAGDALAVGDSIIFVIN